MSVQGSFGGSAEAGRSFEPHDPSMSTLLLTFEASRSEPGPAAVDLVVPVYNEEAGLERSIRRLHAYLTDRFPLSWTVTIADNASTDRTWPLARHLADRLPGVRAV